MRILENKAKIFSSQQCGDDNAIKDIIILQRWILHVNVAQITTCVSLILQSPNGRYFNPAAILLG